MALVYRHLVVRSGSEFMPQISNPKLEIEIQEKRLCASREGQAESHLPPPQHLFFLVISRCVPKEDIGRWSRSFKAMIISS